MTNQDLLDERYGRRTSPARRTAVVIAAVIAAAVIVAFGWMIVANASQGVNATTTGFAVEDDGAVAISFQVTAPPGRAFACALEAQDEEHGIVGWRVVQFEASDQASRAFREIIPTTSDATTGLVNSCWVT